MTLSLPNTLTLARIFISPLFLLIYLEHEALGISLVALPYALIFLLGLSEMSDAFDGYLARKYNQVTDLGKILDPMADSISRLSVFLTLTLEPVKIPMLLIFVILYRDSVVSTLRTVCALKGFALAARTSGKIKAVIQALAALSILLLLIPYSLNLVSIEQLQLVSAWIVAVAASYTLFSGFDYFYANRLYLKKLFSVKNLRKASPPSEKSALYPHTLPSDVIN